MMPPWMESVLVLAALPKVGLPAVFVVSFVSATLLPLGSEPAVFALVKLQPELFWPAVIVATLGNTLGGAVTWWMGKKAHQAADRLAHHHVETRALAWLERFGPKACLLSWLPLVGDPLCGVAGWLGMPLRPCLIYMAIGKFARYLVMTAALMGMFPGVAIHA